VVPSIARVWYLVRGENREAVDELWDRVMKCVSGAAEMTETTYEVQMIKAIHNVLQNGPLTDVLFEAFERARNSATVCSVTSFCHGPQRMTSQAARPTWAT